MPRPKSKPAPSGKDKELTADLRLDNTSLRKKYPQIYAQFIRQKSISKGKGGSIEPDWDIRGEGFGKFLKNKGLRPGPDYDLDHIDPKNPDFTRSNIRWYPRLANIRNRQNTFKALHPNTGKEIFLPDLSRLFNRNENTIQSRITRGRNKGLSDQDIFDKMIKDWGAFPPMSEKDRQYWQDRFDNRRAAYKKFTPDQYTRRVCEDKLKSDASQGNTELSDKQRNFYKTALARVKS